VGKRAKPAGPASDQPALADAAARAMAGDEAAVAQVRALLPDPVQFRVFGDLARMARTRLLADLVGDNPLLAEAVPEKLEALRRELAGPGPNPVEALLVERILNNWLHLHALEVRRGPGPGWGRRPPPVTSGRWPGPTTGTWRPSGPWPPSASWLCRSSR